MKLVTCCILFTVLFGSQPLWSWTFSKPIDITSATGPKIFHHLESSGRKNIAVSDDTIAVTWEDDRDGIPRIYIARKKLTDAGFNEETLVSGKGEAYEPSLTSLPGNRFALAWEEDEKIMARIIGPETAGKAITVINEGGTQAQIIVNDADVFVVASIFGKKHQRNWLYRLSLNDNTKLEMLDHCPIDQAPAVDDQLYPTGQIQAGRLLVAWEDRRPGHTIIMSALQKDEKSCEFIAPNRLSLRPADMPAVPFGKGHGVARVSLTSYGDDEIMAVWADKRDFREGYDIYGAKHIKDGKFGENERVQDDFGGQARQWHVALTGNPSGQVVVAWDDDREGSEDVMLSWLEDKAWNDDILLADGSGPGVQSHPVLTFDRKGNLHIAWVDRPSAGGQTRLRYSLGIADE